MSTNPVDVAEHASTAVQPRGRFAKGRSGNPGGRPKKQREQPTVSAFDIVIDKTLTITQGGSSREVSVDEALQHKAYQDGIAGSRLARREILKMIGKREKALAAKAPPPRPVRRLIEPRDPDNANRALILLGIAEHVGDDPPRLKLLPWAVQHALAQRARPALTTCQIDNIKRDTLHADKVKWPKP